MWFGHGHDHDSWRPATIDPLVDMLERSGNPCNCQASGCVWPFLAILLELLLLLNPSLLWPKGGGEGTVHELARLSILLPHMWVVVEWELERSMYERLLGMGLVVSHALPGLTLSCFAMWISLVWDRDPSLTECWKHSKFNVSKCGCIMPLSLSLRSSLVW